MSLDRDLTFTLNASNTALKEALTSIGRWDSTQDYASLSWAMIAPHARFDFDKNQSGQKTINNGSLNVFCCGDKGNWRNPLTINNGNIKFDGPFSSGGTFDLRITPAEGVSRTGHIQSGYELAFDASSYWEK